MLWRAALGASPLLTSKTQAAHKDINGTAQNRIGRVTDGLLRGLASHVDVIEPVAKFNGKLREVAGVRHICNVGLEEWSPAEGVQYDLAWIQWCVGYLADEQLVGFSMRCRQALNRENGLIVLKENLSTSGVDYYDATDSSLTR